MLEVSSPGVDRPLTEPRHWRPQRSTGDGDAARRRAGDRPRHPRPTRAELAVGGAAALRYADVAGQGAGRVRRADKGRDDDDRGEGTVDIDMSGPARARAGEGDLLRRCSSRRSSRPCSSPTTAPRAPQPHARVELDRKTGHVTVLGRRSWTTTATCVREWDDTPDGFGRIAATTAKQVILQRLRDAEDEATFGEFTGREGDIVSGVIQQGTRPARNVLVDLGKVEAILPPPSRCPARSTTHGSRLQCYVVQVARGCAARRSPCRAPTPTWSRSCSPSRCPRSPTAPSRSPRIAREAGHRTKIAVRSHRPGLNAKGACIGPMGRRVRAVMTELHGEKIDIVDWSDDPARVRRATRCRPARVSQRRDRRPGGPVGPGHRARLPAVAGHRQGGPERPARRPADRLADRHPLGCGPEGHRPAQRRGDGHPGRVVSPGRAQDRVDSTPEGHVAPRHLCAPAWAAGQRVGRN